MPPSEPKQKSSEERWVVQELFQELFAKRYPQLKGNKEFASSSFWKDLYKIFMDKTIEQDDYIGFPTPTGHKSNGATFPTTCTAKKTHSDFTNMLERFLNKYGDNVKEAISCFVTSGKCDLSQYIWTDEIMKQSDLNVATDLLTFENYDSTNNFSTPIKKNTSSSPLLIEPPSNSSKTSLKRKNHEVITNLTVSLYKERLLKSLKTDKENNDLNMKSSTEVLEEINDILLQPSKCRIQELEKKVAEEDAFYEYCLEFFRRRMKNRKEEVVTLDNNYQELSNLHTEVSKYVEKRQEKLKEQFQKEKDSISNELAMILSEEI